MINQHDILSNINKVLLSKALLQDVSIWPQHAMSRWWDDLAKLAYIFERSDIEYHNVLNSFNYVTLQINIMHYYQLTDYFNTGESHAQIIIILGI